MKTAFLPPKAFRFAVSDYLLVKILIVLAFFALCPERAEDPFSLL
jgi:hypothetical protein